MRGVAFPNPDSFDDRNSDGLSNILNKISVEEAISSKQKTTIESAMRLLNDQLFDTTYLSLNNPITWMENIITKYMPRDAAKSTKDTDKNCDNDVCVFGVR